jgi:DNA ligase-1
MKLLPIIFIFVWISSAVSSLAEQSNNHSHKKPPQLMLANNYEANTALSLGDYWVSEKLDGVRAYWDGKQLFTRNGNPISIPESAIEQLPATKLDGELWLGRGTFAQINGLILSHNALSQEWNNVRYMVFDAPDYPGVFNDRLREIQRIYHLHPNNFWRPVEHFKIQTTVELELKLASIEALGGEGLMLHNGNSHYRATRTDDLLKVKSYQDAEATVINHLPGKGKYSGMLGAIVVRNEAGQKFAIGTGFSEAERQSPPPIGSLVTYKYYGLTNKGKPRFASFLRVRTPAADTKAAP